MKLIELISLNPVFETYMKELNDLSYLADLEEETLWSSYSPCMEISSTEPYTGFTQENCETYQRMKFRSVDQRLF